MDRLVEGQETGARQQLLLEGPNPAWSGYHHQNQK